MPGKRTAAGLMAMIIFCAAPVALADEVSSYPVFSTEQGLWLGTQIIKSVTRLDISEGVISGANADYTFSIPKKVRSSLIVERVILGDATMALEKLDFYCNSYSTLFKPALLMSLYVFNKGQWNAAYNLTEVLRSRDYVFAVEIVDNNIFTMPQDRAFYIYCQNYFGQAGSISQYISLPPSQQYEFVHTVFIDGGPLPEKARVVDGVHFVQLRSVCEALGYTVGWNSRNNAIEVSRDGKVDTFVIKNGQYSGRGFKALLLEDRTFVSTSYFIRALSKNVDIDEVGNIYMFSS